MKYYERDGITIYNGDCREILPTFEDKSFDFTVADPPYGCGKADWDDSFPKDWYEQCKRISKSVIIVTGASGIKDSVSLVGDDFIDCIAAWNKNSRTRSPIGFSNWLAAVVAVGKPKIGQNILVFSIRGDMPNHPSPKPIEYMLKLLVRLGGGTVIDPFMGSGTTLVAAKQLGLKAVGIELEQKYCDVAIERLAQGVMF